MQHQFYMTNELIAYLWKFTIALPEIYIVEFSL